MEDPVVGGYTNDKIALRRAIGMGYNVEEEIRVIRQGQGIWATQALPPDVSGHDPKFVGNTKYDPAGARALLDKFGYVDRDKDGWRDLPDGKPLVLKKGTSPNALDRQYDELWKRNMTAIGIRIEFVSQKWPDLLKMSRGGQLQMWQLGNRATTTEGYGFLGNLYGPNAGLANLARFKQPDFDRLYDASRRLPDGPERSKLMREMSQIVAAYQPWKLNAYRIENIILYPGRRLQAQSLQRASVAASGHQREDAAESGRVIVMRKVVVMLLAAALASGAGAQVDPNKVLRSCSASPKPASIRRRTSDLYSNYVNRVMFEPLFRFDFRARAAQDRSQYRRRHSRRVQGRQGVDDQGQARHLLHRRSAFKGRKRELTAADYAFSWKRIVDPKMRSPQLELFDGRIVGMDALVAKAKTTGKFDYDAPVEGLQVVDKYTLRLKLTNPWWDIVADLTGSGSAAVAREVIESVR
jgi:ABC-type transport system substrate-binding protein